MRGVLGTDGKNKMSRKNPSNDALQCDVFKFEQSPTFPVHSPSALESSSDAHLCDFTFHRKSCSRRANVYRVCYTMTILFSVLNMIYIEATMAMLPA